MYVCGEQILSRVCLIRVLVYGAMGVSNLSGRMSNRIHVYGAVNLREHKPKRMANCRVVFEVLLSLFDYIYLAISICFIYNHA